MSLAGVFWRSRAAFAASDAYFPTPLQKFQFFDKYSRFNYELGRRETWIETGDELLLLWLAVGLRPKRSVGLGVSRTCTRASM